MIQIEDLQYKVRKLVHLKCNTKKIVPEMHDAMKGKPACCPRNDAHY